MRGVWALPTVSEAEEMYTAARVDEYAVWSILLFEKGDKRFFQFLKRNWDLLNQALGTHIHVITLLDSDRPTSANTLRYPDNYVAQIGAFCRTLKISTDELPGVFLLNASDGRGQSYWPIHKEEDTLPDLRTLFGDLQRAAQHDMTGLSAEEWRTAVARDLFNQFSRRQAFRVIRSANPKKVFEAIRTLLAVAAKARMIPID